MEHVLVRILFGYAAIGLIFSIVVSLWAGRSSKQAFNSFELLTGGSEGILLFFLFWPLWVVIMILEAGGSTQEKSLNGSRSSDPASHKAPWVDLPPEGAHGRTLTPMRPSGTIRIENDEYDAIAKGAFLDASVAVEVIGHSMQVVLVKKLDEKDPAEQPERG